MPNYGSPHYYSNPYWTPGVRVLILANLAVFGLQVFLLLLPQQWGTDRFLRDYFALWPNKVIEHFYLWQLITCSFLHDTETIFHLMFNLLALYFLGHMVERHYGTRKFIVFYLACAVFASLCYTVVHFILQTRVNYCLGSSGAVLGVLALAACLYPHNIIYFQFLFPVRMRTIVWIIVGINVYMALPIHAAPGVAVSAHLGGILFGYLYYRFYPRLLEYLAKFEHHLETQYRKEQYQKYGNLREEVDRILDKISQHGIGSLSARERELLQKASREYQKDFKP